MLIKKYGDLISGIFTAVLSIVIFVASGFIKQRDNSGVGADFVPRLVSVFVLVLSILLILRGIKAAREHGPIQKEAIAPTYGIMAASFILMVIYVALLSSVGFILTTIVYLFLQILLVSKKEQVHYIKFAAISILSAVGIYLLFVHAFGIMIPAGILG